MTFVVAAGNSGADLSSFAPAAYNEVIAVTALGDSDGNACGTDRPTSYSADDTFASFSNFATLPEDGSRVIAAPGVSIYSTYKGGGYATLSGTSMASPHVAGAAALYLATHLGTSPAAVRDALRAAAEPPDVNFLGECLSGVSHSDPSGSIRSRLLGRIVSSRSVVLLALLGAGHSSGPAVRVTGAARSAQQWSFPSSARNSSLTNSCIRCSLYVAGRDRRNSPSTGVDENDRKEWTAKHAIGLSLPLTVQ